MPPEVRAPLRAVEAQARDLGCVVVEIIKSLVVVSELAPKGVHLLPAGMVILVVAGHENHRGHFELAMDERHAVEPPAVHDVAGEYQHIPGCIGRELVQGLRQVPFPEFKMQIRCNLDFHGNALRARARGPCRCAWPLLHLPPGLVPPTPGPLHGNRAGFPGPGLPAACGPPWVRLMVPPQCPSRPGGAVSTVPVTSGVLPWKTMEANVTTRAAVTEAHQHYAGCPVQVSYHCWDESMICMASLLNFNGDEIDGTGVLWPPVPLTTMVP